MKKSLLVVTILTLVSLHALAANRQGEENQPEAPGEVLATFDDRPTGMRFVWQRNIGWRFAGQTPAAGALQNTAAPGQTTGTSGDGFPAGAPLAVFVDQPTGFRFVWLHEQGWIFVGQEQTLAAR